VQAIAVSSDTPEPAPVASGAVAPPVEATAVPVATPGGPAIRRRPPVAAIVIAIVAVALTAAVFAWLRMHGVR